MFRATLADESQPKEGTVVAVKTLKGVLPILAIETWSKKLGVEEHGTLLIVL